ncbi:methyltransferase type 11 [candidate division MSBL1 archaeon SCGC-AAA382F02]|uniref:Methyltransferase type 11 n=1 Tax=candidate division MSBL1 archaeon SCGC-AAA382F02 TaxID=1698282 RepID=A0A133VIG5_9EURY|nr:methyltransferase type 11 [candidate division MSBL1 archaeon SCGC-AAA382F02]
MDQDGGPEKEHYFENYDGKKRWMSYWYQIKEVRKTKPNNILEVGVGNGTVSNYLRNRGFDVTTADVNGELDPDYVVSVTDLSEMFDENQFDTVLCAEVLEHLPFRYFSNSLKELNYVAGNYVILTLPHTGLDFSLKLDFPYFQEKKINFKIPVPTKHDYDGTHYWTIGKKNSLLEKIKNIVSDVFDIKGTYCIDENPYHRIFTLKVKDTEP